MKLLFKNFYIKVYSLFLLIILATILAFVFSKETSYFVSGIKNLYVIAVLLGGMIPFLTIEKKLIQQTKFGITRKDLFLMDNFAYLTISSFVIIYEIVIFLLQYIFEYGYQLDISLLINVSLSFLVMASYGEVISLSHFSKYIKIGLMFLLASVFVLLYYFLQNYITNFFLLIVLIVLVYKSSKSYKNYVVFE